MAHLENAIHRLVRGMDTVAQWAMVAVMALAVVNIIFRLVWVPILGTYEFIAFLAAVAISFTLASCAVQHGHIAVTMLVERLGPRTRAAVDVVVEVTGIAFFALTAWQIGIYATDMVASGEVSPTTRTPFYPFVYGVGCSFAALCVVLLTDLLRSVRKVLDR